MHRSAHALLLFAAIGCAGGQTGEITELSECDAVAETFPYDELDGASRDRLEAVTTPWSGAFSWEDGDATVLHLDAERVAGEPVARVGFGGCEGIRVPLSFRLETEDGELEVTLEGRVDLRGETAAAMRGSAPLTDADALPPVEWLGPMPEGQLLAVLDRDGTTSHGRLFVQPGGGEGTAEDDEDEVPLGTW